MTPVNYLVMGGPKIISMILAAVAPEGANDLQGAIEYIYGYFTEAGPGSVGYIAAMFFFLFKYLANIYVFMEQVPTLFCEISGYAYYVV